MNAIHTDAKQWAFTGTMQATLSSGTTFEASAIDYQPGFGILAIDDRALNDEPFIYIGFPEAIGVGSFPIEPEGQGKIRAFLGIQGKGPAKSGKLVITEVQATGAISAKFTFKGEDENGQAFEVTEGAFTISPCVALQNNHPVVAASACISPALSDNAGFVADNFNVRASNAGRRSILVTQQKDLKGGLSSLGTYLNIDSQGHGYAFAAVNQGLIATRDMIITDFRSEENARLSFDFSYSFTHNGTDYKVSDGHLEIDWRTK